MQHSIDGAQQVTHSPQARRQQVVLPAPLCLCLAAAVPLLLLLWLSVLLLPLLLLLGVVQV